MAARSCTRNTLMHGKTSAIHHDGAGVFAALPTPFVATRYHSLAVERESLPDCLEVTAWTDDGEIMGLRHRTLPVEGVQFHPESILTEHGHALLRNFLTGCHPRGNRRLRWRRRPSRAHRAWHHTAFRGGQRMAITPQEALQRTIEHREIFHDEMLDLMRQIMSGADVAGDDRRDHHRAAREEGDDRRDHRRGAGDARVRRAGCT